MMGFELGLLLGFVAGGLAATFVRRSIVLHNTPEDDIMSELKQRRFRERLKAAAEKDVKNEVENL